MHEAGKASHDCLNYTKCGFVNIPIMEKEELLAVGG